MRFIILGLIVATTGCASSTGVLPFGKDTYTLNTTVHFTRGGPSGAKTSGLQEASAHCVKLGKYMLPVSTESGRYGEYATYDVVFRCLSEDDPDNIRPDWQRSPDVVIENRQ